MGKRMIKSRRTVLLAGVSALAMLACEGGWLHRAGKVYLHRAVQRRIFARSAGRDGRWRRREGRGRWREVSGDLFLAAGEDLTLFVGGQGQSAYGGGGYGGGGGGSYLASLFSNQLLTAGVNSGDGSIDIDLLGAVPEPSTWAMTLAGFAGLGWLARMRRRKPSPAWRGTAKAL
jgi:PEP-CTERM motif